MLLPIMYVSKLFVTDLLILTGNSIVKISAVIMRAATISNIKGLLLFLQYISSFLGIFAQETANMFLKNFDLVYKCTRSVFYMRQELKFSEWLS